MNSTKEGTTGGLLQATAAEVQRKFGFYADEAMLRPVAVQRHGTTRFVMLPIRDYERLVAHERSAAGVGDADDEQAGQLTRAGSSAPASGGDVVGDRAE